MQFWQFKKFQFKPSTINYKFFNKHCLWLLILLIIPGLLFPPFLINQATAANYLLNPSFTGGTTNWTLSNATYNSTSFYDTAGSAQVATAVGRNQSTTGYIEQTISTQINSGDTVNLSFYYQRLCVNIACKRNYIDAEIALPSAPSTWISVLSIDTIPSDSNWYQLSQNISAYFTESGTYNIRFYFDAQGGNHASGQAVGIIDNLNLDVVAAAAVTTLGPGASEPSNQTIGPGNAAVDMANFTLRTTTGTDTMTAATVTLLPSGAFNNIAEVAITNTANANQCTPVTNPGSNTISFTSCNLGITTSETTYKIRITPKSHANMPAPPGASYAVNGIVSAFTSTNSQAGSDSGTGIITIDNLAPNGATATSGSSSDQSVTINWTSTNNETTNSVLLRWASGSAGAEVPAEGATYTAGNTISGATVACVVSSVSANTPLSRTDGSGASAGCTNTPLINGTQYSYKVFQQDSLGNYDTGVVISGSPFTPQVSPLTTLGPGASEPSNQTIGPGNAAVDMANFTLRTNISTDTMTAATVTLLPAGAFNNIAEVAITNTANANQCTPVTNPGSNTINFTSCNLGITTSETTYKIRITPKTHANMPAPPGASYAVNGIVSAFTVTNPKSGSDSGTGIITIDNLSPNSATATSGSASDQAVTLNWTSTNNETTNSVLLRWTSGSAGAEVPVEGASYTAGNAIGTATVACVVSSVAANTPLSRTDGLGGSAGCTNTPLINGTNYSYKIFQQDAQGNYDVGVVIAGSPFTPQAAAVTTLGPGASEPSNQTIGPGNAAVDMANFTLRTTTGTDTMTAATVTLLPSGAFNNIAEVAITDVSNTNQCTPVPDPTSNTVTFSSCNLNITSTETTYKIRITPKSHANMPVPPGASYDVIGTVTAFTTTNPQSGSDTGSATITIDNLSPNSATATSGSAGDQAVTINWTSTNNETTNSVLLRWASGSAGAEVPAEGSSYSSGNTIGGATVACVVSSAAANTPLTRTDGLGASAGCTNTPLTNGTEYSYKVFQQDIRGNYDVGVVISGSPFTPQPSALTTIGAGAAEPSNQTIGPGASVTDLANFTLRTNIGTDTMTAATVTLLPAGAFNNIAQVAITNTADVNQCTPVSDPSSNTINFTSCNLGITTSETTYKIRITPKTHANMPVPPGASYAVTGTITAFTVTNPKSGSDTGSGIITIDNLSPNSATATSGSAGNQAIMINWTSTNNETTNSVLLRWASGSAGAEVPAEGATYTAGNTISGATVACVVSSVAANTPLSRTDGLGASAGCTNTPLINNTDYSYKIFQQDAFGNYDTGVIISGSPFVPQADALTIIGPGASEPSNQVIGPGNAVVDLANFTLRTSDGTDTMTAAVVSLLPEGAFNNIAQVAITDAANNNQCTVVSNPISNTINFTSCSLPITSSETTYKIRITPKIHANMPSPPGESYSVTGTITAFTTTNPQSGSDTGSAIITIDNLSPNSATATSGSAGDQAVTLSWTSTNNETTNSVILRWTGATTGVEVPTEGITYTIGNTIGAATIACVLPSLTAETALSRTDGSGGGAGCSTTALTNNTEYSYKIFQQDSFGNYDTGVEFTGSPFMPYASSEPVETNEHNVRGKALTDEGDFVYFNCLDEPKDVFPFIFTFFFSVDPCTKIYNLPGGGTVTNFGVNLNDDYTFSGYARHYTAPAFGLVSFRAGIPVGENYNFVNNCADTTSGDCNASNNCSACYDETSQRVYGWARVVASGDWIRLDANVDPLIPTSIYNYDATNPGFFFGYATHPTWGKLSLNCENTDTCLSNNYKVYLWLLNLKELSSPNWNFSQACSIEGSLRTVFRWKRTSGQPTAFQILINTENSTSTAWSSPKITGAMGSASQYICPSVWCSPSPALAYDTSYYWWLKLYDDNLGIESDWFQFNTAGTDYNSILTDNVEYNALVSANPPLTFTTYRNLFPQPFFEWSPLEIIAGTTTDFWTSTSTRYYSPSSPTDPVDCWQDDCGLDYQWTSSHGSFIESPTTATTTIIFGEIAPGQTTSLTITDPSGYFCTRESSILTINYDLPLWLEVKPD